MLELKDYIVEAISSGKSSKRLENIADLNSMEDIVDFIESCGYTRVEYIDPKDMLDKYRAFDNVYYVYNAGSYYDIYVFVGRLACIYRVSGIKRGSNGPRIAACIRMKYGRLDYTGVAQGYALGRIRDNA